jgi:hypothetical protein
MGDDCPPSARRAMSGDEGPNDLRLLLACINMTSVIGHELLSNNNIALLTEGDRPSHSFL